MKTVIQNDIKRMGNKVYRDFMAKLIPTINKNKIIGVTIPELRKYAGKMCDYEDFLNNLPHTYYEEDNIHAFLIEREKNFDKCIEKLNKFLPYIDNWSTCDSMKPKILKSEPEKLIFHINKWIGSCDIYAVRYGINLLMSYYLEENFKSEYAEIVCNVKSDEYYVNMMRAWYFATALAKQYTKIIPYIENKKLDVWSHNKTIQKSIESNRIEKDKKIYLKTLKIR